MWKSKRIKELEAAVKVVNEDLLKEAKTNDENRKQLVLAAFKMKALENENDCLKQQLAQQPPVTKSDQAKYSNGQEIGKRYLIIGKEFVETLDISTALFNPLFHTLVGLEIGRIAAGGKENIIITNYLRSFIHSKSWHYKVFDRELKTETTLSEKQIDELIKPK